MPTEQEAEDWIRDALPKYLFFKRSSLGPDPRLFHDLKIRGVDAVDLLNVADAHVRFDYVIQPLA